MQKKYENKQHKGILKICRCIHDVWICKRKTLYIMQLSKCLLKDHSIVYEQIAIVCFATVSHAQAKKERKKRKKREHFIHVLQMQVYITFEEQYVFFIYSQQLFCSLLHVTFMHIRTLVCRQACTHPHQHPHNTHPEAVTMCLHFRETETHS